jgi:perosamine synthetase
MMNVPIARTVFSESDFETVLQPLRSGWVVQGPRVQEFEGLWNKFTGSKHSIAVTSCTTALHLSLVALGVKQGDEVIVPAFTWVATANVVEHIGAKPVLCDINLDDFNLNVSQLEKLIGPKTRAIIPVHLFGIPARIDEVLKVAKNHSLPVVEDAACGFASRFQGRHVGLFGKTGCFSFHPRKAITTGEGGMITTDDDDMAKMLRSLRDHGASISDLQRHHGARPYLLPEFPYAGYNYRMTDLQAALGCSQMLRATEIHQARTSLAERYDDALSKFSWLVPPKRSESFVHGFQAYVCLFEGPEISDIPEVNRKRNAFMDHLQQCGVSTRPGTHAVHMLSYYREKYGIEPEDYKNAYCADQCSIAFPLFPGMTDAEFRHVIDSISKFPRS